MYMVTGGAGFIGSNIVEALERRGDGQLAVCDLIDGDTQTAGLAGGGGIKDPKLLNLSKRDVAHILGPEALLGFLSGHASDMKAVFHMGAISSTTETDVDLIFDTNVRLSLDLWRWCAENEVPLIYASSAATYGDGAGGFVDDGSLDGLATLKPLNAYGWSKLEFDRRVAHMVADGEPRPPQWAGLKFFNVYGPNEYHKGSMQSVVVQVYPKAAAGEPATLFKSHHPDYEDGGQLRDFIWVGDCVDVCLWLLDNPGVSGLFNCGTGQARSFADLAAAVFRSLDREPMIEFVPTPEQIRDKYQYFTQASTDKLRAAGYDKPFTSLEDGVGKYVREFLHTNDKYL